jgi:hypothetical protein
LIRTRAPSRLSASACVRSGRITARRIRLCVRPSRRSATRARCS